MNDNELEQIAARLGERAAANLDVERTAAAVLARLKSRPALAWWSSPALLRLAAAVTLAVGAGLFASRAALHRLPARDETASQPALATTTTGSACSTGKRSASASADGRAGNKRCLLRRLMK